MVLELALIGSLTVTSYRSVPAQTDSSPNYTSIGEHTHDGGCAISRDLLRDSVPYHSYIYIEDVGLCRVNDTMNKRIKRHVDVWVSSYEKEKKFGTKHKKVYRVRLP